MPPASHPSRALALLFAAVLAAALVMVAAAAVPTRFLPPRVALSLSARREGLVFACAALAVAVALGLLVALVVS